MRAGKEREEERKCKSVDRNRGEEGKEKEEGGTPKKRMSFHGLAMYRKAGEGDEEKKEERREKVKKNK